VARTRTTKKLAQRIDLNYFKRPTPLKRAKFWLSLAVPLLAILWISWHAIHKDARVYSSGRMSEPHAILEKDCASCHVQKASFFSAKADNQACLSCHDGPIHHASQAATPDCASCHTEHRGRINIAAVSEKSCAECHADLHTSAAPAHFFAHVRSFADGHPEFAVLREGRADHSTIKLNHSIHMKPIRQGPTGPIVQLACSDCHRPAAANASWTYALASYQPSKNSAAATYEANKPIPFTLAQPKPPTGREFMAAVTFANSCASCHLLSFDKRFSEGVPHDKPEVIHVFLRKKFQDYAAAHSSELHTARDPDRDLTGRPRAPRTQSFTSAQWVADRTSDAEQLLWRKTCLECHQLSFQRDGELPHVEPGAKNAAQDKVEPTVQSDHTPLPHVAPSNVTTRWMPHARFDHEAHRAFTCVSCHEKALNSVESSEVLLPGIKTCQTCHAPGPEHAESRCFECHTYHDWSKRKEIAPGFTLPPLKKAGN
jgi:hypothetical protein